MDQAQTDNLTTDESLLGTATQNVNETTNTNSDSEYGWVPEKFLKDGAPDFQNLAKSYTELEKKIGSKIGVSSPDEYDFQFANPDIFDMEQFEEIRKEAAQLGVSKDAFASLMARHEDAISAVINQFVPTPEAAEETLRESWGDDYESNMSLAGKAFEAFGEGLDIDEVGNNPSVIRLLANIGAQMGEDTTSNLSAGTSTGLTMTDVQEMMDRPDYWTNKEIQQKVAAFFASQN